MLSAARGTKGGGAFWTGRLQDPCKCESQIHPGTGQKQDRFREGALTNPREIDPAQTPSFSGLFFLLPRGS